MKTANCKHVFTMTDTGVHALSGDLQPAVFRCTNCGLFVSASDLTGIEMLRHVRGWKTWILPLLSLLVAIGALAVSVLALYL